MWDAEDLPAAGMGKEELVSDGRNRTCGIPGLGKALEHLRLQEKPNVVENHSLMKGGRDMELENGKGPIHARSPKLGWGSGTHMKKEK